MLIVLNLILSLYIFLYICTKVLSVYISAAGVTESATVHYTLLSDNRDFSIQSLWRLKLQIWYGLKALRIFAVNLIYLISFIFHFFAIKPIYHILSLLIRCLRLNLALINGLCYFHNPSII